MLPSSTTTDNFIYSEQTMAIAVDNDIDKEDVDNNNVNNENIHNKNGNNDVEDGNFFGRRKI